MNGSLASAVADYLAHKRALGRKFRRFRVLRGSGLGVTGAWRQDLSHARHRVVPPSAGVGRAVGG